MSRTEIETKFLIEHGIDPKAEGQLIDNLFKYPKFLRFREEVLELNKKEEKNKVEENQNAAIEQPAIQAPRVTNFVEKEDVAQMPQVPTTTQQNTPQNAFSSLDNTGEIEKKQFDPTPYIGKDLFIEYIEERKGQYGYYIKLYSQVVDKGDWEIRASAIYGLEEDDNGRLGWPPNSKLYNFLKKFNVAHYRDLLHAPVTTILTDDKGEQYRKISGGTKTQIKIQTRQAKDGKEYLTF